MGNLSGLSLAAALGLGVAASAIPVASQAQIGIGISVGFAPPALPVYEQPQIPGYGYIWTPGYWSWDNYEEDYFWVPGTWVLPPRLGYYWTPAYWGYNDGEYLFNQGYWGPTIGFYGGINYGYGYNGYGYEGGYWRGRDFFYNRNVNNVSNVSITNVYNRTVINNTTINRVSYNGGPAGVRAQPTPQQVAVARQQHFAPTPVQMQHVQLARSTPLLRASVNHGAPPIAATARPNMLRGPGVMPAVRPGAPYRAALHDNPAPWGPVARTTGAPNNQQHRSNFDRAPYSEPSPYARRQGDSYRPLPQAPNRDYQAPYRPPQREGSPYRPAPEPRATYQPRPTPEFRGPSAAQEFRGSPRPATEFRAPPQARPEPQPRPRPPERPDRRPEDRSPK